MRTSNYLLSTLKETPSDAETVSHQLMLRSGMIRKLASGLYTWLPLGLRVLKKIENIVRKEMNRIDALEILMPSIQPVELWQETKRWENFTPPLLKLKDRHERDFCFGPTHEEVITDLARHELHSYKQLPLILYQIQNKFRDELRPRSGVLRAREFLMKDAYSFHLEKGSLEKTYKKVFEAYKLIFTRLGLDFRAVLADTGAIGGSTSHEFQVLAESGEDHIAISDESDYGANVEFANTLIQPIKRQPSNKTMQKVETPSKQSIEDVSTFLKVNKGNIIKTLIVKGEETPLVALIVRGDHELNHTKAERLSQVSTPLTMATDEEIKTHVGCNVGYIGPVDLKMPIIIDHSVASMSDFICGANENNYHLQNVNWERDLPLPHVAVLRKVIEGDPSPDGKGKLRLIRGIEVGHIFQLGNKYSKDMDAGVLDRNGHKVHIEMGCYGIGVSRLVGACIEQNHDDSGIIWPNAMAPFQVAIIPIKMSKSLRLRAAIDNLYKALLAADIDVLLDDRDERPGLMFADMDLIGIPHRLVLGERGLDSGTIEYKRRQDKETQDVKLDNIVDFLKGKGIVG